MDQFITMPISRKNSTRFYSRAYDPVRHWNFGPTYQFQVSNLSNGAGFKPSEEVVVTPITFLPLLH